jgi:hypothetical protein
LKVGVALGEVGKEGASGGRVENKLFPDYGVAYRLGSFIIKTASSKKKPFPDYARFQASMPRPDFRAEAFVAKRLAKGPPRPRTTKRIHKLPGLYATCLLGGTTFGCFSDKFAFTKPRALNECAHPFHAHWQCRPKTQCRGGGSMLSCQCAWRPPLARRVEA